MCNPNSKKTCGDAVCTGCFERSLASNKLVVNSWSPKNGLTKPINVLKWSHKKFWLVCLNCAHEYEISGLNASSNKGCPYCSVPCKKLCEDTNCESCFNKSFASHSRSAEWADTNSRTARMTFLNQNATADFICKMCLHVLKISPCNAKLGHWCSYCANQKLCEDEECQMCFDKSVASHPSSEFWSAKNELKPRQVFKGGNARAWFNCICGHEFYVLVADITRNRSWCGYCSTPPKYLCNDVNCNACFAKSFASHPRATQWLNTNTKTPRQSFLNQNEHVDFQCEKCSHIWRASPVNVNKGRWCPSCKNKTEQIVLLFLREHFPDVKFNVPFDWGVHPGTGRKFRFDFVVDKTIIELDGDQHFVQVGKWTSPDITKYRDSIRMRQSHENGFKTVRLLQRDVFFNKYDWKTVLLESINSDKDVFLCLKGEYNYFTPKPKTL